MKRQRSRNRGGGGGGGGNKPTHNVNRAFDSNGPEGVKIRGHAQHVFEKYQQLARDAASAGDRVLAENHLQHAEHYFRLIRAVSPTRPASDIIGRDAFTSGIDIDFEDESGAQAAALAAAAEAESAAAAAVAEGAEGRDGGEQRSERSDRGDYQNRDQSRDRYEGGRRDNYRDNRSDNRDRGDYQNRDRDNRSENRDQQPQQQPQQQQRPAERPDYQGRDQNRDQGQQRDGGRRERYNRDRYEPRADRGGSDAMAVVEPQATPLVQEENRAPSSSRSSRSRSSAPRDEGASPMLRSQDGELSHAPAFLQQRAPKAPAPEPEAAAPAAPKRRRTRAAAPEPAEEA